MDSTSLEESNEDLVKRFGVYDYIVFSLMLAISAAIGIYYGFKKNQTTSEILMGGRSMSVFPVAMSVLASFLSAVTLLGTPAEMYSFGTQYYLIIIGYTLLIPATAYFYLPVFFNLELTSAYEGTMDLTSLEESKEELVKRFGVYDYIVFSLMLAVSAAIGLYYAFKKQQTTSEILMGGRSLSVFPVAMSVLASFLSGIALLGTPAEMYTFGTQYFMIVIGYVFLIPATAYFYLPVFFNLELTSAYEYLERRFNKYVRTFASLTFSLQMIFYMSVVLYAPALALSQVTGITVWTSVLSIGVICTFYTSIGGVKAVVWTDLFQVFMMFAAVLVILIKGAYDEGGIAAVWERNVEGERIEFFNTDVSPLTRHTVWSLSIGGYFTWLAVYGTNQAMVQRYLTLPTLRKAQAAIWINLPGLSSLLTITCLTGMVIYSRYRDCDPVTSKQISNKDQLFPLFVMDVLGDIHGLPGLFVAGIFSGALSTISPGVNSLAAVTLEDIIKVYINPKISEKWAVRLTKLFAVIYGLVAILLVLVAEQLGGVLEAALSLFGMIGGPVLGVFTLGMFFPWPNSTGAVIGLASGLAVSFWIGIGAFLYPPSLPAPPVSTAGCPFNLTGNFTNTTNDLPIDVWSNTTENFLLDFSYNIFSDLNATILNVTTTDEPTSEGIRAVYRISYLWYSLIGSGLVVIIGLIVSFLTGPNKGEDMDPSLFSPFFEIIFFWLPSGIRKKLRFGVSKKDSWNTDSTAIDGRNFNLCPLNEINEEKEKIQFKQGIANISYLPHENDFNNDYSYQGEGNNVDETEKTK